MSGAHSKSKNRTEEMSPFKELAYFFLVVVLFLFALMLVITVPYSIIMTIIHG